MHKLDSTYKAVVQPARDQLPDMSQLSKKHRQRHEEESEQIFGRILQAFEPIYQDHLTKGNIEAAHAVWSAAAEAFIKALSKEHQQPEQQQNGAKSRGKPKKGQSPPIRKRVIG